MPTPWYALVAISLATPLISEAAQPNLSDFELAPKKDSAEFQKRLAESNARTIQEWPSAGQKGTALYEWIAEDVTRKRKADPAFFENANWPWNITCEAVREFKAKIKANDICARVEQADSQIVALYQKALSQGLTPAEQTVLSQAQSEADGIQSAAMDKTMNAALRAEDKLAMLNRLDRENRSFIANTELLQKQAVENQNYYAQAAQFQALLNAARAAEQPSIDLARAQDAERRSEEFRQQQELNRKLHNVQQQLNDLKAQTHSQ